MPDNIESIEEFNVEKASNGFIVKISYQAKEAGDRWALRKYEKIVATSSEDIKRLVDEWFGRLAPSV